MEHNSFSPVIISKDVNGKKQSTKMRLFFAVLIIIVLIALIFFLENAGTAFPGGVMNRITVANYLDNTYPDSDFSIDYQHYDSAIKGYIYNCVEEGTGRSFQVISHNLSVKEDGYFNQYLRNFEMEEKAEDYLKAILEREWAALNEDVNAEWQCAIVIPYSVCDSDYTYEGEFPEDVLLQTGSSLRVTATLTGNSGISFEEYKELAYKTMRILQLNMFRRPEFLQVFYYRNDQVLQYESQFSTLMLDYSKEAVMNGENIHFYVELNESQITKYKTYRIARIIYTSVIVLTVVILSVLYIWRKIKKSRKSRSL